MFLQVLRDGHLALETAIAGRDLAGSFAVREDVAVCQGTCVCVWVF